jgi:hypothetical protein
MCRVSPPATVTVGRDGPGVEKILYEHTHDQQDQEDHPDKGCDPVRGVHGMTEHQSHVLVSRRAINKADRCQQRNVIQQIGGADRQHVWLVLTDDGD